MSKRSHLGNRLEGLKKALLSWDVDPIAMITPSAMQAFETYDQYIICEVEDCKLYDKLKKQFTDAFGVSRVGWLVSYTNYLVRNSVMRKKDYEDKVTESIVELVNTRSILTL